MAGSVGEEVVGAPNQSRLLLRRGCEVRYTLETVTLDSEHSTVCREVGYSRRKPEGGWDETE